MPVSLSVEAIVMSWIFTGVAIRERTLDLPAWEHRPVVVRCVGGNVRSREEAQEVDRKEGWRR